jgi:hypothetical protein
VRDIVLVDGESSREVEGGLDKKNVCPTVDRKRAAKPKFDQGG